MGSLKGCPAAHAGPATCSYSHPPRVPAIRASSSTFMRLILPSAPPRFGPSPWVGIRWSRVPGQAVHRPGYRANALSEISFSPCQSRPRRPVMTPTPVVSSNVPFWTVAVPSWDSGPMLRNATDALFHVLHPAAITLTAAHTRPPSPRPSAATCEHEQLSVMARQPPLLHTLALKSYPKRCSPSASASTLLRPAATRKGLTSLFGPKDQDGCDTVQFMDDQPASDHVLPGYTRYTWVLPQQLDY